MGRSWVQVEHLKRQPTEVAGRAEGAGHPTGHLCAARAGVPPQHPDCSVGWVFDREIGLIRGGTDSTPPIHDGNCGTDALHATIVGNRRE